MQSALSAIPAPGSDLDRKSLEPGARYRGLLMWQVPPSGKSPCPFAILAAAAIARVFEAAIKNSVRWKKQQRARLAAPGSRHLALTEE